MYSRRRRGRLREVEFSKLESIKEGLGIQWKEICLFLGITTTQLSNYRSSNGVPADRFYAFKDALLVRCEEKARQERELILSLFKE